MSMLTFVVILAVIGFVLWLVVTYVPMPPAFRTAMIVIVILAVLVWTVRLLGVVFPRL